MSNKFELLMPAGNIEKGIYAFEYGADAIYIGPKAYSLRARSSNFDIDEIKQIVEYAHSINKKVYVVLNIICHNAHLSGFEYFFKQINEIGVDAAIVADPFIFNKIKEINPNFDLHISTQQSICNSKAAMFWKNNGATRIVLGRETSCVELKMLLESIKNEIEIEYFIHGAVCISYSGRCMMSNNFSSRDANVGGCAQSCRWNYNILDFDTNNKYFTMSAKDMSLFDDMKELMKLNVASFKVEGRMKSLHYVSTIAACYKKLIDNISNNKFYDHIYLKEQLLKAENRLTDNAWFDKNPNENKMLYHEEERDLNQIFAFTFIEKIDDYHYKILSKNYITINDQFELLMPNMKNVIFSLNQIKNKNNELVNIINTPMEHFVIKTNILLPEWKNKIVRKI
ncbi:peptidase U32 family protein [Malacoplasma muris]|uniref:peptidase U32 family protein n=1 Tax=Malacoplasma muris TaxID=2119 RepID=UPI00398E4BD4